MRPLTTKERARLGAVVRTEWSTISWVGESICVWAAVDREAAERLRIGSPELTALVRSCGSLMTPTERGESVPDGYVSFVCFVSG